MITTYQEELRAPQVAALWAGDIDSEGDLTEYLGRPFEATFGFFLELDELPEFAALAPEPRRRAKHNQPFEKADVRELLGSFSWSGEWIDEAERLCRRAGFGSVKSVVVFPSLRYRPELELSGGTGPKSFGGIFRKLGLSAAGEGRLYFVGNLSWPGGAQAWEELQRRRILTPPFPKLIVQTSEDGVKHSTATLRSWTGHVQLESWKGFATDKELFGEDSYRRFSRGPDGDLSLDVAAPRGSVNPPPEDLRSRPSAAQARAFQHLLDNQAAVRDAVIEAIFKAYPQWRENYFGETWSSDGGKTFQTGWDSPDMCPPEVMPEIKNSHELMRLIRLSWIYVLAREVDGFARIGFSFTCKWDEEHGLGVLTHRGQVIEVGAADSAFDEAREY